MEKNIKSELVEFVNEYNRVCERNFDYEVEGGQFKIITEGFVSKTLVEMFMERFSEKELSFVIAYVGEHLEMIITKSL